VHVAIGDQPGEDRSAIQNVKVRGRMVDSDLSPFAMRSMVLLYFDEVGRSRIEQKSPLRSDAGLRPAQNVEAFDHQGRRHAIRHLSNAAEGTSKPAARSISRQSHSTAWGRHAAVEAGLAVDPRLTVIRFRTTTQSNNPIDLARHERVCDSMSKGGVTKRMIALPRWSPPMSRALLGFQRDDRADLAPLL
jgi:hypothetical protein